MGLKDDAEIVGTDTFKGLDPVISTQITRMSDAISSGGVDHIMLCSTNPGAASAVRQIRAAGIDLPILSGTAMDGTYWVEAVPGLKDFYLPSNNLTQNDPRDSVNEVTAAYAAKYGAPPATQYAYLIYGMLDMWVAAVKEAGTTDAKAVVDVMNGYDSFETTVGLRKLSPMLHIQTEIPMLVTSYADGKQTFVKEWDVGMPIPKEVLYRLAK
ncbi:ABC transporter substrate-binding protein [Albimonas sp. CAU 1670]|uniref:ABC transporter substrate-binding protein n=1 Tax=Albimonas sp. CAU 1670 TaxID=3032599 RepID=UPI0023DABCA3|nr:ABC transporter substrate-binding protein [Albimonas sp. CAU 1670]MDF2230967.1 ABC transporter substrate-binding protein [Albimonas sp. CAU 1670]